MPLPHRSIAALFLLCVGCGWWLAACKKSTQALPSAGTAEVLGETMVLYSRAETSAPPAAGLIKGDRVHLLGIPLQPGQQWVPAQLVKNNVVSEPGFARVAELGNWSSDRGEEALRLLLAFSRPAPGAGAGAVRAYWKRLEAWEQRHAPAPGMERIAAELSREYLFWAAEASRRADLDGDRSRLLARARSSASRGSPREAGPLEALARQIESAPPAPARPPGGAEPDFTEIRALWARGEYPAALQRIDQILAESPGNAQALSWKSRLQAAIEAERALSR